MLRQQQPKKKPSPPPLAPPPRGGLSSSSSARIPPDVNLDADNDDSYYVRELKQWDVLLGRGTGPNEHIGNKYYRDVIEAQTEAYFATNNRNRKERMKIIQGTINHIINDKKGRFLKRLDKHEIRQLGLSTATAGEVIYCLADSASQREKTKQAFRYANKKGITNHDDPPPKDEDNDDNEEEEEEEEERHNKKVAVSVVHHRSKSVKSRDRRDEPQSCHNSGETLTRYPVQKKARKEDAPTKSSSSLRAVPPPPPVVSPNMNVETAFSNIHPSALLDLPALINSGGVGGRGGSNQASFLLQTLFAAAPRTSGTTTAVVGGGSLPDFATAATTTRITPAAPAYPPSFVEIQQHMSSHHQQSSTTRRFGSGTPPLTLEDVLTPRRNVQVHDIANAISAEAVLQSIMTRRRFTAIPPQSEMMLSQLLVPQHRHINAAPATTTGTTGRNLLNNTSNNPSTQRGFYAALELAELLVGTTKGDNYLPRGGGGGGGGGGR